MVKSAGFRVAVFFLGLLVLLPTGCGSKPPASTTSVLPVTTPLTTAIVMTISTPPPSSSQALLTVLSGFSGNVTSLKAGTTAWSACSAGQKLGINDILKTAEGASATVTFFDGSSIELAPSTEIKILELANSAGAQTTISLSQQIGQTLSRVAAFTDPASRYDVRTPAAIASVRGSVMLVAVAEDGATSVGNVEGKIVVTAQGQEVAIPEGQRSEVAPGKPPEQPTEGVAPPGPDVELGYDSGTPSATLASRGYAYHVLFKPDCGKFILREFSVYAKLYGQLDAALQCDLVVKDKNLNVIWQTKVPHTAFATEAGWFHFKIPDIPVESPFYVGFRTNSPPTNGVTVYYDYTQENKGSEIFFQGNLLARSEWQAGFDPARCNWLMRVTGASADSREIITAPLAPNTPASWKSLSFEELVKSLDTPQKISASLLANFTPESHYSTDPAVPFFILTPQQVYEQGKGSCNEYTVFAYYVLQQHGYNPRIMTIKVKSNQGKNHAICIYQAGGYTYALNNGALRGPYTSYESICQEHDSAWSSYQFYDTWQKFQAQGQPDIEITRS
jgi:hypothetical protein